jgi:hypothetical protein
LITTIVGGYPDESLSSYAYRLDKQGKPWGRFWRPIIDGLFWWQSKPHCAEAYIEERLRYQMPPVLR